MLEGMPLVGFYDHRLVGLSIVIGIATSYAALDLAGRVIATDGRAQAIWLVGGAATMGIGIWSMHYIGMLAFRLPIPVLYDWPTVLISLLAAILASGIALIVVSRSKIKLWHIVLGSLFMGFGIAGMHYIGMMAMRLAASCFVSPAIVSMSVGLAIAISFVAIKLTIRTRDDTGKTFSRKLCSAVVMGAAIPIMHYTGMAAATFSPAELPSDLSNSVNISMLGTVGIALDTILILVISVVTSTVDRRYTTKTLEMRLHLAERAEQQFRALLESAPDAHVIINQADTILLINSQTAKAFGYSRQELMGQSFDLLVPERFHGKQSSHRASLFSDPQACSMGRELYALRKDGSEFPTEIRLNPLETDEGLLIIAAIRDITERLTLERELNQAQKLESVGRLASGIAHEINTPTQFVGDNVRFLSDSFSSIGRLLEQYQCLLAAAKTGQCPKALIDTCEAINREADMEYLLAEIPMALEQTVEGNSRVARIVGAMKHFAHPDSEEKTYVNLNHAIENTVIVTRNEWKFVADLTTDLASDLPLVPCLLGQFNQVILNMIINATHAIEGVVQGTPQKGLISITSRQVDTWAEIRITDTGTGMPEDIQHKIFDPFFTTKEVGKGTGQGLAIARSVVVDKHGGTIAVVSQVGKGTTFIIRLGLHDSGAKCEMAVAA